MQIARAQIRKFVLMTMAVMCDGMLIAMVSLMRCVLMEMGVVDDKGKLWRFAGNQDGQCKGTRDEDPSRASCHHSDSHVHRGHEERLVQIDLKGKLTSFVSSNSYE
jgi:hypothetical protein